ncbi:MAG: hypothetical protein ACRDQH_17425, partial [Pseudonocardiaceae bacterium]
PKEVCAMPADAPRPAEARWCDIDGTPISLFCEVEQVADGAEPSLLGSRLHQRGHVAGWALDSLYVCFPDNQMISVRPYLLRVLDDAAGCSQV